MGKDNVADDGMPRRWRLGVRRELLLALAPTLTVLVVLALVEAVSRQRLLFASLASSAFLIFLDPGHSVNKARTLIVSQVGGACIGMAAAIALGPGYVSAGSAMVLAIVVMILLDNRLLHGVLAPARSSVEFATLIWPRRDILFAKCDFGICLAHMLEEGLPRTFRNHEKVFPIRVAGESVNPM